jgi:hypothetical protein
MIDAGISSRIPLEEYARLLGEGEIEELRALAKPLRGRSIFTTRCTARRTMPPRGILRFLRLTTSATRRGCRSTPNSW